MSKYWLSYEIAEKVVGGRSGYSRRTEVNGVVDTCAGQISQGRIWKDTTSFIVFESNSSIDIIAGQLKRMISQREDLFLIRRLDSASARICGKISNYDVFGLFLRNGSTYLIDITDGNLLSKADVALRELAKTIPTK